MGTSFEDCICCGTCEEVCPQKAIVTAYAGAGNYLGHKGITVNLDVCDCCGKCVECCPVSLDFTFFLSPHCSGRINMGSTNKRSSAVGPVGGGGSWGSDKNFTPPPP